ncbi:MAG: capsule biosynthesis protein [Actinomycetota bacterium]|nr:capsule biosynthesis protein [Actinomycetota bacterium]
MRERVRALLRPLARRHASRRYLPNWSALGLPAHESPNGSRVLLATMAGGNLQAMNVERLLAAALTVRGHHVDAVLCDGALPACIECSYLVIAPSRMASAGPSESMCRQCTATGVRALESAGASLHSLSKWILPEDHAEAERLSESALDVASLTLDDIAIGQHARAGALRFEARAVLADGPESQRILLRYLRAAVLTCRATQRMIEDLAPDVIVLQHGIYVPQGVVVETAKTQGVRVVTWTSGYPESSMLFAHGDTYHRTMLAETPADWADVEWTPQRAQATREYLDSRRTGSRDWIRFGSAQASALAESLPQVVLDPRPLVLVLPNVSWDAQIHFEGRAFASQTDWLLHTIEWARTRPDLQIVIRAHPGEVTGFLPAQDPLREILPIAHLPENVSFVDSTSPTSTYELVDLANVVIVYGTKVGVEALAQGRPVITVGEAWIRGKELSIDVETSTEYQRVLDQLPFADGIAPEHTDRALRYAHHLFLRRMIPVRALQRVTHPGPGRPLYWAVVPARQSLAPEQDTGLDAVCKGIVEGTSFVLDSASPPQPPAA